jgi:hypothetical protein
MIAVTVVTPSYKHLEKEAVKRFKKHSGLPVQVIRVKDTEGFTAKLELDRYCGKQRVVFFDVDFWLLRPVKFDAWDAPHWYATHDSAVFNPHAFPSTDCGLYKLDKLRYFNSGFFICDLRNPMHRKVFQRARQIHAKVQRKKFPKPVDVTDQFYLNYAVQELGVGLNLVPLKFNYYHKASVWGQVPYIPRDIIGLHAAGYKREDKLQALQVQEQVFKQDNLIVCAEAYQFETARIFDMR